jgi:general stress protein CsbA
MLFYAIFCPNTSDGIGDLFYYPLYVDHSYSLVILYTTGTWLWVFTISMLGAQEINDQYNETLYKLVAGNFPYYVYVAHYFAITVFVVVITRPAELGFTWSFFIIQIGAVLLLVGFWYLVVYLAKWIKEFYQKKTRVDSIENKDKE